MSRHQCRNFCQVSQFHGVLLPSDSAFRKRSIRVSQISDYAKQMPEATRESSGERFAAAENLVQDESARILRTQRTFSAF
jgi:hypothetical protein